MTLLQIRYFIAAVESENLSKAAQKLNISRPAITRALRAMEDEFGLLLFSKEGGSTELTEDGHLCYKKCSEIQQRSNLLEAQMRAIGERMLPSAGCVVKLCITPAMAVTVFPRLCRELDLEYPNMKLEISEYSMMQARAALENGTIDFHLASDARRDTLPKSFCMLELEETEYVLCMPKEHRLANKTRLTVEDIGDEPLARNDQYYFYASYLEKRYQEKGLTPNIIFHSFQLAALREMVAEGLACVAHMRGAIDDGHAIVARPFDPPIKWTTALVWNDSVPLSSACKDFLRFFEGFKERLEKGGDRT